MQQQNITNSPQVSLGFYTPQVIAAIEFRRSLSSWVHKVLLSHADQSLFSEVFHRSPSGQPINSLSAFRFTSEMHWSWLHAIGPKASTHLTQIAEICIAQAHTLPSVLRAPRLEHRNVGLSGDLPTIYQARQLIVCKDATQYALWNKCSDDSKIDRIASVLKSGLDKQAQLLNLQDISSHLQPSDIHLLHEWTMPKLQGKIANAYVRLAHCTFTLPCQLHGNWAAGSLINKGFGQINVSS